MPKKILNQRALRRAKQRAIAKGFGNMPIMAASISEMASSSKPLYFVRLTDVENAYAHAVSVDPSAFKFDYGIIGAMAVYEEVADKMVSMGHNVEKVLAADVLKAEENA